MNSTKSKSAVTVRPAMVGELPAIVKLLRSRDERPHPATAVSKYLFDLDPHRIVAWLATVEGQPAALNAIYLRDVWWGNDWIRAGYWAHLFVDPEHRKLMIYPQLVAAMLRAARELPLDMIYTATRRQQVADSHIKLGFRLLSTLSVKMKPLRPARLLVKHFELPRPTERIGGPFDATWRFGQRLRHRASPGEAIIETLPWDSPEIGRIVELFNTAAEDRIHQRWEMDTLQRRFAQTIEGWPYTLLVARELADQTIAAAALVRIAERGPQEIRAAVLMELVAVPGRAAVAPLLLQEIDHFAHANNAEIVLALDGAGADFSSLLARWGYYRSPETYNLIVWPKAKVDPDTFAGQIQNWRFTFADHDAF